MIYSKIPLIIDARDRYLQEGTYENLLKVAESIALSFESYEIFTYEVTQIRGHDKYEDVIIGAKVDFLLNATLQWPAETLSFWGKCLDAFDYYIQTPAMMHVVYTVYFKAENNEYYNILQGFGL